MYPSLASLIDGSENPWIPCPSSSARLVDKIRACFGRFLAEGFLASGEHDFRTSQRGQGIVLCGLNDAAPLGSKCEIGILGKGRE